MTRGAGAHFSRAGLGFTTLALLTVLHGCKGERGESENRSDSAEKPGQAISASYRRTVDQINRKTGAPQIEVVTLRKRLQANQATLVLDIREREEHELATIPDALWIPPSKIASARLSPPEDALVVTYCTAGYRSGMAAVELSRQLDRQVLNLEGGIIAWFNSGAEVFDSSGKPASRIHTYSDDWAQYVTRK